MPAREDERKKEERRRVFSVFQELFFLFVFAVDVDVPVLVAVAAVVAVAVLASRTKGSKRAFDEEDPLRPSCLPLLPFIRLRVTKENPRFSPKSFPSFAKDHLEENGDG